MQIFICKCRIISHFNHNFGCKELPSSIAIELTKNKLLIKTELKEVRISCPKLEKKVQITSTFSIINLKEDCKLISKEFYIDQHSKNISDSFMSKPFEVFGYDLETPTLKSIVLLNNHSLSLQNLTNKLKTDLKINADLDLKNEIRMKELEQKFQLHSNINWILIATLAIIVFVAFVIVIIYFHKRCKNSPQSNINISMEHDFDKKREDKAKVKPRNVRSQ